MTKKKVVKIINENFFREIFGQENCGKKINSGRKFFCRKNVFGNFPGAKYIFSQKSVCSKKNLAEIKFLSKNLVK